MSRLQTACAGALDANAQVKGRRIIAYGFGRPARGTAPAATGATGSGSRRRVGPRTLGGGPSALVAGSAEMSWATSLAGGSADAGGSVVSIRYGRLVNTTCGSRSSRRLI